MSAYFRQTRQQLADAKRDFGTESPEVKAASTAFTNAGGVPAEVEASVPAAKTEPVLAPVEAVSVEKDAADIHEDLAMVKLAQYAAERGFGQVGVKNVGVTQRLPVDRDSFTQADIEEVALFGATQYLDVEQLWASDQAVSAFHLASTEIRERILLSADEKILEDIFGTPQTLAGAVQLSTFPVEQTQPLTPNEQSESNRLDSLESQRLALAFETAEKMQQNQLVMQRGPLRPAS